MAFTRREFVVLATSALLPRWLARDSAAPIRITLAHSDAVPDLLAGAHMCAEEVRRAAQLLRRPFEFTALRAGDYALAKVATVTGLIVAAADPLVLPASIPVVDADGSAPRRCASNVYQLTPSRAMLAAAPGGELWHHSLSRFGAGQLNDRFRAAGVEPGSPAWAGWFAVKCLWESQLRGMTLAEGTFDGHKGQALTFSAQRTLLQPLYLIENDSVAATWSPSEDFEDSQCIAS